MSLENVEDACGKAAPGRAQRTPFESVGMEPLPQPCVQLLWAATVVANIGGWMYNASASWLMTSLSADPLMVSLVQAASLVAVSFRTAGGGAGCVPFRQSGSAAPSGQACATLATIDISVRPWCAPWAFFCSPALTGRSSRWLRAPRSPAG